MNNYYDLLEISQTASEAVIRAAYKAKVKQWHPDNFTGEGEKEKATKILQELNEALETLTDADRRKRYDENMKSAGGSSQRSNQQSSQRSSQKSSKFETESENEEELAEILDRVQKMIVLTRNESEYLQLHRQIRQSAYPDHEKILMAEALDYITSVRLEEEIRQADSLAYCKKEVSDHRSGTIWILVIGFVLTAWFSSAWWIAIIIAVLGYIGSKDDRTALKLAEQSEARIRQYRLNGFRI